MYATLHYATLPLHYHYTTTTLPLHYHNCNCNDNSYNSYSNYCNYSYNYSFTTLHCLHYNHSSNCSYITLHYTTLRYTTLQHSTAQHSAAQGNTAQHSTGQHKTRQHNTTPHHHHNLNHNNNSNSNSNSYNNNYYNYNYTTYTTTTNTLHCATPQYIQRLRVRLPLQSLQNASLQPPAGSLCHPRVTTTNPPYRFPIFETSATALCGTTDMALSFFRRSETILLPWGPTSVILRLEWSRNDQQTQRPSLSKGLDKSCLATEPDP